MGLLKDFLGASTIPELEPEPQPTVPVIESSSLRTAPWRWRYEDGAKFPGGFGDTELLITDYWTLRHRSSQLFETNLYARGLIRRLVTSEINTGLKLEAAPVGSILGLDDEFTSNWSEDTEKLFAMWSEQPMVCDAQRRRSFGQLQSDARTEALIAGDVLCVLRQDRRTGMPTLQLISGNLVQTPIAGLIEPRTGNTILHGVEIDSRERQVAYHIRQTDGTFERLPAFGARSGRRNAWLLYGTDRRLDQVRGKPMLSLIMQSLREVDRYRDAALRKAVLNSMLAMFVKKNEERAGSLPMTTGAIRRTTEQTTELDGETRVLNSAEFIPGLVVDELQYGEEIQSFGSAGTDEKFGTFEESMIQAVAWANEVPPEILRLSFSSNYSASQAAINEFKIYLNRMRADFATNFTVPVYTDWLISATLTGRVDAPGFLQAWRRPSQFQEFGAWLAADWSGQVKPSTDPFKLMRAYELQLKEGVITRARVARELGNGKYSQMVKQLERENEQLAEANEPLAEETGGAVSGQSVNLQEVEDAAEDAVEESAGSPDDNGVFIAEIA